MFQIWEMESGFGFMDYRTHLHISILGASVFCFCFSWLIAIKLDSRKTRIGILTEVYLHVF